MLFFKNYRLQLTLRAVALCFSAVLLYWLLQHGSYRIVAALVAVGLVLQVVVMVRQMEQANREFVHFLQAIKHDDFTQTYKAGGRGKSFEQLAKAFNAALAPYQSARTEREAELQFLKNVFQHVGIGIISYDAKQNVQLVNTAAKRLLQINQLNQLQALQEQRPTLYTAMLEQQSGSRSVLKLQHEGQLVQLAMYTTDLLMRGQSYRLVTLQNIGTELEEQEMEAWQNLIKVLTHEIMNSVTPISSLAATVDAEVGDFKQADELIDPEDLEDIQMAVDTIKRRSESLIRFVGRFRSLTHIPTPQYDHVLVTDLLKHVTGLLEQDCRKQNTDLTYVVQPEGLVVTADAALLEQVLINLVKNAAQALQSAGTEKATIEIKGEISEEDDRPQITVTDNGPGIEPEALQRIFIPFFTTKQEGSGIGLSLSRQIMRQHKGNLTVRSEVGKGAEFLLKF